MRFSIALCLMGVLALVAHGSETAEKSATDQQPPQEIPHTEEERDTALKSARAFITEVDKEEGEIWDHFAEMAKKVTSKTQWNLTLGAMKLACGANVSRKNLRGACYDRLPDAPPGRFFIFDLDAEFARLDVRERVVMVKEETTWKVAGYFRTKRFSLQGSTEKP